MEHRDVAVIGSGFAGTILARILHRLGIGVVLLERYRHPRFAIGESSTPLAAICLERLARRYDLPDLAQLAAYGRWLEHLPEVRRGLKRGFTFYGHRPGTFRNGIRNDHRLLVAASPEDAVADSHWLRADVDEHLVTRAVQEGVDFRDRTEIEDLERGASPAWKLSGRRSGRPFEIGASIIVDGSGAGGFLAKRLAIASSHDTSRLDTALVYGHFRDVRSFVEVAREDGAQLPPGPYPDERAAVHHLFEEGWLYGLRFDHQVVSAGVLLRRGGLESLEDSDVVKPEELWWRVLARYSTLAKQFADASPVRDIELVPQVQRRLAAASGQSWALLPHTVASFDPMFSTGIAWSLFAVERLGLLFENSASAGQWSPTALRPGLERYGELLQAEADQILTLMEAAWAAKSDFALFTDLSLLYFATVSFAEAHQRLCPEGPQGTPWAWEGFLGAGDATAQGRFRQALARLKSVPRRADGSAGTEDRQAFSAWVRESIADHNVAGLADPRRHNLYPVDLDLLMSRAELLGLTREEMRAKLHLLRGR